MEENYSIGLLDIMITPGLNSNIKFLKFLIDYYDGLGILHKFYSDRYGRFVNDLSRVIPPIIMRYLQDMELVMPEMEKIKGIYLINYAMRVNSPSS
jgi:hypothetical protein